MSKIIPIKISSVELATDYSQYSGKAQGTFETTHADEIIAHGLKDTQPFLLLGKEAIYDILPEILLEVEEDAALWLTSQNSSKRKIAQLIMKWKKDGKTD